MKNKIELYTILRRIFAYKSIEIDLPYEVEIDNGYGIEGSSDYAYFEFNKDGSLDSCILPYMHFITEQDNLEYQYNIDEYEAYRVCLQDKDIREEFITNLRNAGASESYISETINKWSSEPSDIHASVTYDNKKAMPIDNLIDCQCPENIMLRCGCSCGASTAEKSYNKGFILNHSNKESKDE